MVGKLFKYEAKYYLRLFIPFGIAVLASALFMRILFELKSLLEIKSMIFSIIYGSSQLLFGVSIAVCFGAIVALSITRFYKNLYTSEGYLSFTLPVTAAQHIWTKLLASLTFYLSAIVITFAGFFIVTVGEVLVEIVKAASYLFSQIVKEGGFDIVMFIIELLIAIFTVSIFETLLFYTCISLGQTAKKNRVFMSFVYYFLYYVLTQVIGTIIVIVISILTATGALSTIGEYVANNISWFKHVAVAAAIVINLGISAIFFFANRHIMIKKLNLE